MEVPGGSMKIFELCLAAWLLIFSGCGKNDSTAANTPAAEDLRILSLSAAADHILDQLGAAERIIGIDKHGKTVPAMQDKSVIVSGGQLSREMLHKYRINYAIIWYYQADLAEWLQREGIPVMCIEPIRLNNYGKLIMSLGKLVGKETEAQVLDRNFQNVIGGLGSPSTHLVPIYMELYSPWKTPGRESFISDLLNLAGGCLAGAADRSGTVSPEKVCRELPQAVVCVDGYGSTEDLLKHPALANTPAGQHKRVYKVPRRLIIEGVAPLELLAFFKEIISQCKGS